MFESPFHFTVDVIAWAKHITTHVPSGHWLHFVAYALFAGLILLSWRVIQDAIKKQHAE